MKTSLQIFVILIGLLLLGTFFAGVYYRPWVEKHVELGVEANFAEIGVEDVDVHVDLFNVTLTRSGALGDLGQAKDAALAFKGASAIGIDNNSILLNEPTLRLLRASRGDIITIEGQVGNAELKDELERIFKASSGAKKMKMKLRIDSKAREPWWFGDIGAVVTDVLRLTNRVDFHVDGKKVRVKAEAKDLDAKKDLLDSLSGFTEGHRIKFSSNLEIPGKPSALSIKRDGAYVILEGVLRSKEIKHELNVAIEATGEFVALNHCLVDSSVEETWWHDLSLYAVSQFLPNAGNHSLVKLTTDRLLFFGRLPNQADAIALKSIVAKNRPNYADVSYKLTFSDPPRLTVAMVHGKLLITGKISSYEERDRILNMIRPKFQHLLLEEKLIVTEFVAKAPWLHSIAPLFDKMNQVDELRLTISKNTIHLSGEVYTKEMMQELADYLDFIAAEDMQITNDLILPPKSARKQPSNQAFHHQDNSN